MILLTALFYIILFAFVCGLCDIGACCCGKKKGGGRC